MTDETDPTQQPIKPIGYTHLPEPFKHIRIDVLGIQNATERVGLTVGVMDTHWGKGSRSDIRLAEAKAKAVLKAIRKFRRLNPEVYAAFTQEADNA